MSKKKECKVAKTKKAASEIEQRGCAMKVEYRPVQFVEEEHTTERWPLDFLTSEYHWKVLKPLLSEDPELQILKAKLIGRM